MKNLMLAAALLAVVAVPCFACPPPPAPGKSHDGTSGGPKPSTDPAPKKTGTETPSGFTPSECGTGSCTC